MIHRRLASPLHAARAGAGAAYCLAFLGAALVLEHPLVLGVIAVSTLLAGRAAGVSDSLYDNQRIRFVIALVVVASVLNGLVSRNGLTVVARLGEIPPVGQVDITSEALAYGALLGARVVVVLLICALFSACVDPDELLRLLRRVSFRSALTAVLATRLIPVLTRDAKRLEEARRCRADGGGGDGARARLAVVRAVSSGALDRAVDVAATLEVRGYGTAVARAGSTSSRLPWSRHDRAFAAAAAGVVALILVAKVDHIAAFSAYPSLHVPMGPREFVLAAALLLCALLPFADRRGIAR